MAYFALSLFICQPRRTESRSLLLQDWKLREKMDLSLAISCPSVRYQLAGMKKIQQILALPNVLERFISNKHECNEMRSTFAQFLALDSDDDKSNLEAIEIAMNVSLLQNSSEILK